MARTGPAFQWLKQALLKKDANRPGRWDHDFRSWNYAKEIAEELLSKV